MYSQLLAAFRQLHLNQVMQDQWLAEHDSAFDAHVELMEGKNLRHGDPLVGSSMGGVEAQHSAEQLYAEFTSESELDSSNDDSERDVQIAKSSQTVRYMAQFSDEDQ